MSRWLAVVMSPLVVYFVSVVIPRSKFGGTVRPFSLILGFSSRVQFCLPYSSLYVFSYPFRNAHFADRAHQYFFLSSSCCTDLDEILVLRTHKKLSGALNWELRATIGPSACRMLEGNILKRIFLPTGREVTRVKKFV